MKSAYWLRSDLRLLDNKTLTQMLSSSRPCFLFWTPNLSFFRAGPIRRSFILGNLLSLQKDLLKNQVDLHLFQIPLKDLIQSWPDKADWQIFFTKEYCPEEIAEESLLQKEFKTVSVDQNSLIDLEDLPFEIKKLPEVFTQFRKIIEDQVKFIELPKASLPDFSSYSRDRELVEQFAHFAQFTSGHLNAKPQEHILPGEQAGLQRLEDYFWKLDRLKIYKETRNGMVNWEDSSKFSPWLSVGAISAKRIHSEILRYERSRTKNESTYWLFFELLWRDYFRFISLKKGPQLFRKNPALTPLPEKHEEELLDQWKQGLTDSPFINANMKELNQTGWMSNRGRQNVSSYLAKTLLIDWRKGAQYFEQALIDYDPSSNWGNWAYQAGVGQDPRQRKFNPEIQAKMYDPEFEYQRKWI